MILVLVPVLCAAVGLVLYAALRATGVFEAITGESSSPGGTTGSATTYTSSSPSSFRERIEAIPPGWLVGVVAVAGVWILGWLVVLAVGLSLLT